MSKTSKNAASGRLHVVVIALIVMSFWAHALLAVRGKSSTFDEPIHTFSSWLIVNHDDFRVEPEHPSLWKWIIGIGLVGQPLNVDLQSPEAVEAIKTLVGPMDWMMDVFYHDPSPGGVLHGEHLIWRARVTNSLFMIVLGCIVARWAWACGGGSAAVVAVALLAFDPNFLAHGALVTNDVATTTIMALATYCAWYMGERLTWQRVLAFVGCCAASLGFKASGLLLAPMLGLPLLFRALSPNPWLFGRGNQVLQTRFQRLVAVVAVCLGSLLLTYAGLWTAYGFREAPTASGQRFDDAYVRRRLEFYGQHAQSLSYGPAAPKAVDSDRDSYQLDPIVRAALWSEDRGIFPQAWLYGINSAIAGSWMRTSFLMGEQSDIGFRWYFPLTIVFKTPAVTLLFAGFSAIAGILASKTIWKNPRRQWIAVCLLMPPVVYLSIAIRSNLNIGIRHILPVYVPVFVACGVMAARFIKTQRSGRILVTFALIALALETTSVFPNYLCFFNRPSGGSSGGVALLSDSNLDWGQDLPALSVWYKEWRADNPSRPFYLYYFGTVEPAVYGIDYANAKPRDGQPPKPVATGRGVYAISATYLQGLVPENMKPIVQTLRRLRPLAVINGTIYIYDSQQQNVIRP